MRGLLGLRRDEKSCQRRLHCSFDARAAKALGIKHLAQSSRSTAGACATRRCGNWRVCDISKVIHREGPIASPEFGDLRQLHASLLTKVKAQTFEVPAGAILATATSNEGHPARLPFDGA